MIDDPERDGAEEEADRLRKQEPPPVLSAEEFAAWRSPRRPSENPTRLDNPLWHWLVRTRWNAYMASQRFEGPDADQSGPMWTFDRFGMSQTPLPDGRLVHVGGEHEDYYDADFFIYNDVVVIDPDGTIAIHGYPAEDFPPTDFHSATRVGDSIILIGGLGYPSQRMAGATPVYRLSLATIRIEPMPTHGDPPGWIRNHHAVLVDDGQTLSVQGGEVWLGNDRSEQENIDAWSLDLASGRWRRLTSLDWQRWTMRRVDRKRNRLWDLRQELWRREHDWLELKSYWRFEDEPDAEALALLYRLDAADPKPERDPERNVYRTTIDGVLVRFDEDAYSVRVIVEGTLATNRLLALKRRTLEVLERLDGAKWEIEGEG